MKLRIAILLPIGIASVAMLNANAAEEGEAEISLTEKQQSILDKALAGRTAGKAVTCISQTRDKRMTVVSDDIIIFGHARGKQTIYVNKPAGGCRKLKDNTLVSVRPSPRLCSGDIARIEDFQSGTPVGSCAFSEFIPYSRNKK